MTVDDMLTELLRREGLVFTNDPADRGGATKFGITQQALSLARGHACSADDVRDLGESEAREIYRSRYLVLPGLDKIKDTSLQVLAFDIGVNHGTRRAVQWLQQLVGVPDDGALGPQTEAAIASKDPSQLYRRLCARRVRFYGEIIAHDPERVRASKAGFNLQAKFASGWAERAASFIEG